MQDELILMSNHDNNSCDEIISGNTGNDKQVSAENGVLAYDQTQIRKECRSERYELHGGCYGKGA